MARPHAIGIRRVLTRLFPRRELERLAREHGVVERRRKVRPDALFWTLVLGFGAGRDRTITGLRHAYARAVGVRLVPSAFYDRFTPALVRFLKAATASALARAAEPSAALRGVLASFRDLVIADATVLRLHALLAGRYPGCRTNHTEAALKLHTVVSVAGAGLRSVRLTSERVHDGRVLSVGPWVRDRLLLMDLGYYRFQLFSCIRRNGGFFVSRLKQKANPIIVAAHRRWRGRSIPLVGRRLQDVLAGLERQVVDVEVELAFQRRVYAGVRHLARERFRLVGVRDPQSGQYHLYLTNIPVDRLSPEDIATSYRARWIVELLFRELKSRYRAEDLPSRKPAVVEALVYAVLLTLIASRALLDALRRRLGPRAARTPAERWAALVANNALDILRVVVRRVAATRALVGALEDHLFHEAVDPSLRRLPLLRQVETRTPGRALFSVGAAHA